MSYYASNPHYAPDDFSEEVERLENCEAEAGRYFAEATKAQHAVYAATMAHIRPWSGSPRWERQKAAAERLFRETTTEARELCNRTVAALMADGEISETLSFAWDALIERSKIAEAA